MPLDNELLCNFSVTEGIEALAVTRVIVRPTGALARQGIVKNAQVPLRPCAAGFGKGGILYADHDDADGMPATCRAADTSVHSLAQHRPRMSWSPAPGHTFQL
jgi:hypothetical protein